MDKMLYKSNCNLIISYNIAGTLPLSPAETGEAKRWTGYFCLYTTPKLAWGMLIRHDHKGKIMILPLSPRLSHGEWLVHSRRAPTSGVMCRATTYSLEYYYLYI